MTEKHALRRFWFKFAGDGDSPLGYGVTAWTEQDALGILQAQIFEGRAAHAYAVTPDVDVSALDAAHVRPNMESPTWRGIWFPRGFAQSKWP